MKKTDKLGDKISPFFSNKYSTNMMNPTVLPTDQTEMNVPIPSLENIEQSKEYEEENEL